MTTPSELPLPWRQRFAHWLSQSREAVRTIPSAFKIIYSADRIGTSILIFSTVVSAAIPAIQAYAGAKSSTVLPRAWHFTMPG